MKRLSPFRPLILPIALVSIFVILAFNYSLLSSFDQAIIELVRQIPASAQQFMERVSILGNFYEDIIIILLLVAWEMARRNYNRAFISALALTAFPLFFLVKETVSRARPTGEFIIATGLPGYSFPSGHAVTSAMAFGLLAILLYSHLKSWWKYVLFSLCLLVIFLVGVSRVYLGAHYPTDVIAGWLLALSVLGLLRALSIFIASRTTRKVSDTTEDPEAVKK